MGCNNSISKGKKVDYIEVVKLSDNKKWTFLEKDEIDKFIKALDDKEKFNGKFEIRTPDYSVDIYFKNKSKESYSLWLGEEDNIQGILMDENTIWYIDKKSNPTLRKLLS